MPPRPRSARRGQAARALGSIPGLGTRSTASREGSAPGRAAAHARPRAPVRARSRSPPGRRPQQRHPSGRTLGSRERREARQRGGEEQQSCHAPAATTAPASVAARFTASLSNHLTAPCTVAPSSESNSIPRTPATTTATATLGSNRKANAAIKAAPAIPPTVPTSVIPPSVPAGTGLPVVISRGGLREYRPISVAHVSAVAAASAPANAAQLPASAASAATPPFAKTWRSFRVFAFDNKLDETKKARSRNRPRHPNPHVVARPTASAAVAPRRVSHLTRRTIPAARAF